MQKYMGLFVVAVWMAIVPAWAQTDKWTDDNCTNRAGNIYTINGVKFCRSNQKMNWWSAHSWCDKHGGTLIPFEHLCPATPFQVGEHCSNQLGTDMWVNEAFVQSGQVRGCRTGYNGQQLYCSDMTRNSATALCE